MTYKLNLLTAAMATLGCIALPACVDDKYDLSVIDTTVRVEVSNLVVPLKMDEIRLESVIPDDKRVKVIEGHYAFVETGGFWSSPVYIEPVWIVSQPITSKAVTINYIKPDGDTAEFDFSFDPVDIELHTPRLPADITYIDDVTGETEIKLTFILDRIGEFAERVSLTDIEVCLPKGLTVTDASGGVYDPATGLLSAAELQVTDDHPTLAIKLSRLDLTRFDTTLESNPHKVTAKSEMSVRSAKIRLSGLNPDPALDAIRVFLYSEIPDFLIYSYSGGLNYHYQGLTFDDIRLDGLPDFLSQAGTDLKLVNPCMYLKVHNPMQVYDVYSLAGLYMNARHDFEFMTYAIDDPDFRVGTDHPDGVYDYCMSPAMPQQLAEGFDDAEHVAFTSLSDILSNGGNPDYGIPSSIEVKMDSPRIPEQHIVDMPVGIFLDELGGTYEFRAPLALEPGSVIKYSHTATGWGNDEFDYITVTQLDIDATVTSEIPLSLDMKAYPVDWRGDVIGDVEIKGVTINAGRQPQTVHITITGNVTGFDGIRYEAVARSGDNELLSPDMVIRLTDLRPTISGYYLKKL